MDLRHARTFVTVAELGTVSRAAQQLHVAQPALSRQIADLEHELGLALFDRIGRRLVLTSAGEQILGDCRGLLNHAVAVGERAQLLRDGDVGVLRVAAAPQHIESVFAGFLHLYAARFPNVEVRVLDAVGADLLSMLERGEIHLGQSLVHAVPRDDRRFDSMLLRPVEILAAFHPKFALAQRTTIDIARLAPHPLLLMHPEFVVRRTFDAACRLAGLKPNVRLECRAPHALLALAEAGHGVAVIPSALQAHRYDLRIAGITYRSRQLREPLNIMWNRRRPRTRYATAFCEMLAAYVREVFPITRPTPPAGHARRR